ncbi:MAG: T9SS type A sorting domain-containing protein [Ferruginibacter sp.]
MRFFLILLLTVFVVRSSTRAQYVTIPDPSFRQYFVDNYPTCLNASNMLDTTCSDIINELSFPRYLTNSSIANWEGFQYFKNLQVADFSTVSCSYLPGFPNSLKQLIVGLGPNISTVPTLPDGLTHFTWANSINVINFPALPNSLIYLDCSNNLYLQPLSSLPTSLKNLNCEGNPAFTSLPVLPATLDTLHCVGNVLTYLPSLPSTLKFLNCSNNSISIIPALPVSLKYLDCGANLLTWLPALPAQLEYLSVGNNSGLTALPPLPATLKTLAAGFDYIGALPDLPAALENLYCGFNNLTSIPVLPAGLKQIDFGFNYVTNLPQLPPNLNLLGCYHNQLTSLPELPQTLINLSCAGNLLTGLPLLPASMTRLDCNTNQLTSLPPLPHDLTSLDCSYNSIYFLPPLPDTLSMLTCHGNNITCLPVLPTPTFMTLQLTMDDQINCLPNAPAGLSLFLWNADLTNTSYPDSYPLCSATNNIHHCEAFPLMTGYVYNDNNNNNIKDANEPYRANVKVQLSNAAFTMTNSNGYYQIPADSIGSYSVTATAPNFFAAIPAQHNYNFSSYDTLVTGNFALQATTTVDSLTISVLPINWAARPGFAYPYLVSYQNVGTTTLSPNIVFNYDNSRLDYDSNSNAAVTNSGLALSLAEPGFVAGMQKSYIAYFRVKPTAVIGDSVRAHVSINAAATTAMDSTIAEIRGSYDPNDKSATPVLSPTQVANGNYIYYTIRFQNTGTDTAFNVVITDTLNSQLQAATLQVINTSHPAKITVTGNAVSFEFLNILLPDSNVNELKSHGYVTFRIKPQATVALNSSIPNIAAIYFDYNSPVITNTALTNILEPQTPVPLKLLSFNVTKATGNSANAFWNTSNEINVQSYNIEMSVDARTFSNISSERAKGFQYNDYTKTFSIPNNDILYFRLKMINIDGRFTYSPVVTLRNDKSNSFSFLNNPVKNELNISLQDDALKNTTAKIYNAQGVLVKTILLQHDIETVNVRSLPAGTYYLVTEKGSKQFLILK